MQVSHPNEHGVLKPGHVEIVARRGRWYAQVKIALTEDGLYRHSVDFLYSYGGMASPIWTSRPTSPTLQAAIDAGLHELLRVWPRSLACEPQSARDELDDLRQQIESRLCQPSLF